MLSAPPAGRRGSCRDVAAELLDDRGGKLVGGVRDEPLYATLERLAARGLVEPERDEVESGRLRRYYRLTDAGAAVVATETQRMAGQARAATRRLARRTQLRMTG